MKNLHFCTEGLLTQIYEGQPGNTIETYRTGWIPGIYSGDIINLTEKNPNGKDKFICKGKVVYVLPLQFKEFEKFPTIHGKGLEEIKRYKRNFHLDHWFFNICIKLCPGEKYKGGKKERDT